MKKKIIDLTEEEEQAICNKYKDCWSCPLHIYHTSIEIAEKAGQNKVEVPYGNKNNRIHIKDRC